MTVVEMCERPYRVHQRLGVAGRSVRRGKGCMRYSAVRRGGRAEFAASRPPRAIERDVIRHKALVTQSPLEANWKPGGGAECSRRNTPTERHVVPPCCTASYRRPAPAYRIARVVYRVVPCRTCALNSGSLATDPSATSSRRVRPGLHPSLASPVSELAMFWGSASGSTVSSRWVRPLRRCSLGWWPGEGDGVAG